MKKTVLKSVAFLLFASVLLSALPFADRGSFLLSAGAEDTAVPVSDLMRETGISAEEYRVVQLVNRERVKEGLAPLSVLPSLQSTAQTRASELAVLYSHTRPDGTDFVTAYDPSLGYTCAGENIAMGQTSAEEVMTDWMNSSGHRANILNPSFTHIGAGYENSCGGWTQNFMGKPCEYSSIRVTETAVSAALNSSIDDLGLLAECVSSENEISYLPVSKEYITGFSETVTGTQTVTCTVYGKTATFQITTEEPSGPPAPVSDASCRHEHTVNDDGAAPTCRERGFEPGVFCTDCKMYISGHAPIPHTEKHVTKHYQVKDYGYYQCGVCGRCFTDASAKTEISRAEVEITVTSLTSAVKKEEEYKNTTWRLYEDGTLILSGKGRMSLGQLTYDPPPYDEYRDEIKKGIVSDGYWEIASSAFSGFSNLESVVIGDAVKTIDVGAFAGCSKLKDVYLPASLELIGPEAFAGCASLKTVYLPEKIQTLDTEFFASGLEEIYLPDSLTKIGGGIMGGAFEGTELTDIYIPGSVTEITNWAFVNCENLKTIIFEDSSALQYFGMDALKGTAYYNDASNWRNHVLYLDHILVEADKTVYGAADQYFDLSEEDLSSQATHIAAYAFKECNLRTVHLPGSITDIDEAAFSMCYYLEEIRLPSSLRNIGSSVFSHCRRLEQIEFPEDLLTIGGGCFLDTGLKRCSLPEGIKTLESGLFGSCYWLESVDIPEGVESIGNSFHDCTRLKEIRIPKTVAEIAVTAFNGCSQLETVQFDGSFRFENTAVSDGFLRKTGWYDAQPEGLVYFGDMCIGYKGDMPENAVLSVKNGTKSIAPGAFIKNDKLKEVRLPDTLERIGASAFCYCTSLEKINFPNALTEICNSAFYNCASLKDLVFPDSLIAIGREAFYDCASLEELGFPASLRTIGVAAFERCAALKSVAFPKEMDEIGTAAFFDCEALATVRLPETIDRIGTSAFYDCFALSEISFPVQVREIGAGAFIPTALSDSVKAGEELYLNNVLVINQGILSANYLIEEGTEMIADEVLVSKVDWYYEVTHISGDAYGIVRKLYLPKSIKKIGFNNFDSFLALKDVYYAGSREDWEKIEIGERNTQLLVADIHFDHVHAPSAVDLADAYGKCDREVQINASCECGAIVAVTIPPVGHRMQKTEAVAAACTIGGTAEYYTCEACKKRFADAEGTKEITDIAVPALGHQMTKTEKKAATCTAPGNVEYYTCSRCGLTFADEEGRKPIENVAVVIGHSLSLVWEKAPTCTEPGNISYYLCGRCGAKFTDVETLQPIEDVSVPAAGHKLTKTASKAATCTEPGNVEYYTCSVCGGTFSDAKGTKPIGDVTVKAAGHKLTETAAKAATCTGAGNVEYYACSVCGRTFSDAEGANAIEDVKVKPSGHSFGEWKITKEATVSEEGVKTRTCSKCGAEETQPIEKLAATYKPGDVDGDGNISAADARLALRRSVGLEAYAEGSPAFLACDVDRDGNVSAADARLILRASVGLEDPKKWAG